MEQPSMSQQLISRSEDLTRLRSEGYDIEIRAGYLLVKHVPYVNESREVRLGVLACPLDNNGTTTIPPTDHTILFGGEYPCRSDGSHFDAIIANASIVDIDETLRMSFCFSTKPPETHRYDNYHHKVSTYANLLSGHAEAIDPIATPRPALPVVASEEDGPFRYLENASARAGITAITEKLRVERIAIVGLGGSGSYVLDQIAKTPVREIHLFDGDVFSVHNVFRAPGAATLDELMGRPPKVTYWANKYDAIRRGIVAHHDHLVGDAIGALEGMDFVFLCLDGNKTKREIVVWLEAHNISFIDVGMGLLRVGDAVSGQLRITTSTPENPALTRIPFSDDDLDDVYATNIQVADLNALNAVLAVIKWKKLRGFYVDLEQELNSVYAVDGNQLINE